MKKIFILTGEPSGDKLASTVISKLKQNSSDIEYSCVGGAHLSSLGIKSIYDLKTNILQVPYHTIHLHHGVHHDQDTCSKKLHLLT